MRDMLGFAAIAVGFAAAVDTVLSAVTIAIAIAVPGKPVEVAVGVTIRAARPIDMGTFLIVATDKGTARNSRE